MVFTKKQKMFICRCLAEFCTIRQIIDHFEERYGERIYMSRVLYYKDSPKWEAVVSDLRSAWQADLAGEIMASKRSRLKRLDEVYVKAMERNTHAAAVAALREARQEMEGNRVALVGPKGEPVEIRVEWDAADGWVDADGVVHSCSPERPSL